MYDFKKKIFNKKFIKRLLLAVIFSVLATQITYLSSMYIYNNFGEPEIVKDLLWMKLPYIPKAIILSEALLVISMLIFAFFSYKNNLNYIPYAIFLISFFHFLRAGLIILTPLGFPQSYQGFIKSGTDSIFMFGAFPSGHLSIPYLLFMLSKKRAIFIISLFVGLFLLISHSHYSLDLVGTLLVAYPLFKFSEKYFGKFWKDEN